MTPHRAGGAGSVCTDLKLVLEQVAGALIRHDHHDQIDTLRAGLQAPTAAADAEERRRAPRSIGELASGQAAAVLATEDESAFQHAWHHGNALGALVDFVRNSFVGSS